MAGQPFEFLIRLFRCCKRDQLHFVELVEANESSGVLSIGSCLAAKTGGVGGIPDRQCTLGEYLVAVEIGHRHFGGWN
jgi:hypothetical protein